MYWTSVKDEISRDLGKAKSRLTQIDTETAVLQKEKKIVSDKVLELEFYLERIDESQKPLPSPPTED